MRSLGGDWRNYRVESIDQSVYQESDWERSGCSSGQRWSGTTKWLLSKAAAENTLNHQAHNGSMSWTSTGSPPVCTWVQGGTPTWNSLVLSTSTSWHPRTPRHRHHPQVPNQAPMITKRYSAVGSRTQQPLRTITRNHSLPSPKHPQYHSFTSHHLLQQPSPPSGSSLIARLLPTNILTHQYHPQELAYVPIP